LKRQGESMLLRAHRSALSAAPFPIPCQAVRTAQIRKVNARLLSMPNQLSALLNGVRRKPDHKPDEIQKSKCSN